MLKLTPITYVPVCVNMCVCMCECNLPSLLVFIAIERGNHKRITTTKKPCIFQKVWQECF